MSELRKQIDEASTFIAAKTPVAPQIAIILGTGLGALADEVDIDLSLPYEDIPHFPVSTVAGHQGRLIVGRLVGKPVVAMQGRFHRYEGYSLKQVTFPVRVMRALEAKTLIVSNASGGMNPLFEPGTLMIIIDHINLMADNPLTGPNDDELGPRFPDMSNPYAKELIALTEQVAQEEGIPIQKGVYVGVTGPNLETAAEYRFLRGIGGDVVGMSTVPEVIVAVHAGMKTLGISVITDSCVPDALQPADFHKIVSVAQGVEPTLTRLVKRVIKDMEKN